LKCAQLLLTSSRKLRPKEIAMKNSKSAAFAIALGLTSLTAFSTAQAFNSDSISAESAILSAGSRAAAISRIRNVPSVGVINLGFNFSFGFGPRFSDSRSPDPSEFKISAEKNAAGINHLRRALAANPATRAALADHGVRINQVVGVDISSNGSLRIYKLP
jgi:hypothetical protein